MGQYLFTLKNLCFYFFNATIAFMKIKILGSGPSIGVPMMLGKWKNPDADRIDSKNFRLRSSFFLDDIDKKLLVECGPDFRLQSMNIDSEFNDIFLSHNHHDHIGGVWELENAFRHIGKKFNVWCNQEVLCGLKRRFAWLFDDDTDNSEYIKVNVVEKFKVFNDLFILSARHGCLESSGFRYKNFVFTADMNVLPEKNKQYMRHADVWLLQCNNYTPTNYTTRWHTDLPMALKLIEELQPKRAILTHLADEFDYKTVSKELPSNVELAFDGMVINIG